MVLSAGYFGFFGHAGFVDGLLASGLVPVAYAGTSAGGLVGSMYATGMKSADVGALLTGLKRQDFWDPDPLGLALDAVRGGQRPTGLLRGNRFRALLERHLPVKTFEDCATPAMVVCTDLTTQSARVIASGDLASAIHATCAYPGMFQAVRRDGALLWDGGLVDKAPALALIDYLGASEIDVLLVHYLPSRDAITEPTGALAYVSAMTTGMAALRKDHFRLQLQVLKARGVEVHVVTSMLPKVSPKLLQHGSVALAAGRQAAIAALAAPSGEFTVFD